MTNDIRNHISFKEHPLAPLFFEYINILRSHHFHKEADDLLKISDNYQLPENKNIITKIIIEMQKMAVADEQDKFQLLLEKSSFQS